MAATVLHHPLLWIAAAAMALWCLPLHAADDGQAGQRPINRWVLVHEKTPKDTWENGVAYDPASGLVVQHGGHVPASYVQSSYTHLYDPASNTFRESTAPFRPQRRCLVEAAYVDSLGRVISTQGGSGHGSIAQGGLGGDYKTVFKGDPRGPWLYDVAADRWEDCRILPPIWRRVAHAQAAYDASSDALVCIASDKLLLYCPRTNRLHLRDLPEPLHGRLSYGIAADPVHRKIVLFGGTGPGGWVWVPGDPAAAYDKLVHADTWLYDVATDTWKQVDSPVHPPKGMPLHDHRSLPMLYHPPSGRVLLLQTPLDRYVADTADWPATELWAFDVAGRTWSKLPTENNPAYVGRLVYAGRQDELLLFGGGRDGVSGGSPRPSLSRHLYALKLAVAGVPRLAPARPGRVVAAGLADGVHLAWQAEPGVAYDVFRAPADPFPGPYEKTHRTQPGAGRWLDTNAAGKVYAYQVAAADAACRSLPAFNQPVRPGGLLAGVDSPKQVTLRWKASKDASVVGYRVYRARGPEFDDARGTALAAGPVKASTFVDKDVDLSDGVARIYWVTAVNAAGIESGASPVAYSMPDAPLALDARKLDDGGRIRLTWQWPEGVAVAGFVVYQVDRHINTHEMPAEKIKAWYDQWKTFRVEPGTAREFVFTPPAGERSPHQYFYLRAVNVLGQEGFRTDIVSATDSRFHPALGEAP